MEYKEITETIIDSAFEVTNELGSGFLESVYEKTMMLALIQKVIWVDCELEKGI